ncbi:hypothetical protein [Pseudomonas sp. 6D_7.1_Bac1]|nr:hypothetical protein [Pseudomonas sp. 6D_7.1_Bac1]MCU1751165.1 hypothetical protein [Pseudomonas sp. 6D_7.1_Bac1]
MLAPVIFISLRSGGGGAEHSWWMQTKTGGAHKSIFILINFYVEYFFH